MLSPEMDKASGYANSPQMVAALTFFGDLVLKDKVASLSFGNPEDAFGQKRPPSSSANPGSTAG